MTTKPARRRVGGAIAATSCIVGLIAAPAIALAEPIPSPTPSSVHHDQQRPPDRRGTIISSTKVRDLDAAQLRTTLRESGYPTDEVRYGATGYRVSYRTVDYHGRATTASGLVSFPNNRHDRLQPVLFAHGTSTSKPEAPSTGGGDYHQAGALSFAGAGFASIAPDYLGLGTGPGRPPYLDTRTEVSASTDLLRAARTLADRHHRGLRSTVHVTGFSQGAHAALTTAHALQRGTAGTGFRLGATAPISGAYSLRDHQLPAMINGDVDPKLATLYTGYLFTSWNALRGIYDDSEEIFRPPYASIVDDLYDGTHSGQEVFEGMPDTPAQLLNDRGMSLLADPSGPFADAVDEYDAACRGWRPSGPIRLYYATGDAEAVNGNTEQCVADFARRGVSVPTVDLGELDHVGSGAVGVVDAAGWFRSLDRRN